jgi:hypothetical protein
MKNWMRRRTEEAWYLTERVEMEVPDVDRLGLHGRRVQAERLRVVQEIGWSVSKRAELVEEKEPGVKR